MSKALIIVDVQNDFVEGGSLAVDGGRDLAARFADAIASGKFADYDFIVTTQDYHIDPGSHFSDTPDFIDSWPRHCVAGTEGAEIVESLRDALVDRVDLAVHKGQYEAAYSGFEGSVSGRALTVPLKNLAEALRHLEVDDVAIGGIATDYCCRATALDAVQEGFNVTFLSDFSVGINPEKIAETLEDELPAAGVTVR